MSAILAVCIVIFAFGVFTTPEHYRVGSGDVRVTKLCGFLIEYRDDSEYGWALHGPGFNCRPDEVPMD